MKKGILISYFFLNSFFSFSQIKEKPFHLLKGFTKKIDNTINSRPQEIVEVGNYIYFTANSTSGIELWRSDGTESGTALFKDIYIGGGSSIPSSLININGILYFSADDGVHGREIWKSDGTTSGTFMILDINPGSTSSITENSKFINNIGTLFFKADDGVRGEELWKTNGTSSGTALIKDVSVSSGSNIFGMASTNGISFFYLATPTDVGIWKSDGTSSGTVLLKNNISFDDYFLTEKFVAATNGIFYFIQSNNLGQELWKTNGTVNGTVLVKQFKNFSNLQNLTVVNSTIFFTVDDGAHGNELWKTDGSTAGTVLVKDIANTIAGSDPDELTNINGILYFSANDILNGREVWKSDGSLTGTILVKNISPIWQDSNPSNFTLCNNKIFFFTDDGVNNFIWMTDGTDIGTKQIISNNSALPFISKKLGNKNGLQYEKYFFIQHKGTLFFNATTKISGSELWKCDTLSNTLNQVKEIGIRINSGLPSIVSNKSAVEFNGKLFFWADDGSRGFELWQSDGTTNGTALVKDIYPGYNGSSCRSNNGWPDCGNIEPFLVTKDFFYFTANDGVYGTELWRSDGTTIGTYMVKDIYLGTPVYGAPKSANPSNFKLINGVLYFIADDGIHGRELWKSDGTATGTSLIKDINVGAEGIDCCYFDQIVVKNILYLVANDGVHESELWKSDGTNAGTVLVKDINPGLSNPSNINGLIEINGTLFFSAYNPTLGYELWKSDGTSSGTLLVKDINPGSGDGYNSYSIKALNYKGFLFFISNIGDLWKSDGTGNGTVIVKKFYSSQYPYQRAYSFSLVNDSLFFRTNLGESYYTDGTTLGTYSVPKIPINYKSFPSINKKYYFSNYYKDLGFEPHLRDSTLAKDIFINDINIGPNGSYPEFFKAGNYMYAFAKNDSLETSLWVQNSICTIIPSAPIVRDTAFCLNSSNSKLSAISSNGNTLYWYGISSINGVASNIPSIVNTSDTITKYYYVSQANDTTGCESLRSKITVKISTLPIAPTIKDTSFCNNFLADSLKATPSSNHSLIWYGTNSTGGNASYISPKPNTSILGNFGYYVSQKNIITGCEGSRVKIGVLINPLPAIPLVRDTNYCNNINADTLRVSPILGTKLSWYGTNLNGGTASNLAIKPNTSTVGTINYYLTQVNIATGCESPRAKIGVIIKALPIAPIIKRDTANYLLSGASGTNWYKDGTILTDTTQKYKPTTPGSYTAKTTSNGCTSVMSTAYYYLVTDIINLSKDEFIQLAPNPFINQINFDFVIKGYQKLNIEVFDLETGTRVSSQPNLIAGSRISLGQLVRGTYVIRVSSNDNKIVQQFKVIKRN
jgi:ELWxxDGT repeat protein